MLYQILKGQSEDPAGFTKQLRLHPTSQEGGSSEEKTTRGLCLFQQTKPQRVCETQTISHTPKAYNNATFGYTGTFPQMETEVNEPPTGPSDTILSPADTFYFYLFAEPKDVQVWMTGTQQPSPNHMHTY